MTTFRSTEDGRPVTKVVWLTTVTLLVTFTFR
jgi:hypothetical protein